MTEADRGFAIYLHWPFCAAKCPYCDFNSHVAAVIDQDAWAAAYRAEIDRYARELPGREVASVFFGGGTPSLMAPRVVGDVLDQIARRWRLAENVEITLEANPTSADAGRFAGYREAGVNRLSLGVQALNDGGLKRLGRLHDAAEARAALSLARNTFDRVSFDLIYARQNQTLNQWNRELEEALGHAPDHLSLYQLTIEEGTAFGARAAAGRLPGLPDDTLAVDMYALTQERCDSAGLPMYEVSNHARPGQESRHNLIYWRSGEWLGIGPGAHGRLNIEGKRWGTETERDPAIWLANPGEALREEILVQEQAEEALLMGLRLLEGLDLALYERLYGFGVNRTRMKDIIALGLLEIQGTRLRVTADGWPVLNAILLELARD